MPTKSGNDTPESPSADTPQNNTEVAADVAPAGHVPAPRIRILTPTSNTFVCCASFKLTSSMGPWEYSFRDHPTVTKLRSLHSSVVFSAFVVKFFPLTYNPQAFGTKESCFNNNATIHHYRYGIAPRGTSTAVAGRGVVAEIPMLEDILWVRHFPAASGHEMPIPPGVNTDLARIEDPHPWPVFFVGLMSPIAESTNFRAYNTLRVLVNFTVTVSGSNFGLP